MCQSRRGPVQNPETACPLHVAHQPALEASIVTTTCRDTCSKGTPTNHLAARVWDWEVSPMLAAAWESTAVNSGSDSVAAATPEGAAPPNLHPQRTIAHPPMLLSTSDHLSARRMKR